MRVRYGSHSWKEEICVKVIEIWSAAPFKMAIAKSSIRIFFAFEGAAERICMYFEIIRNDFQ